jgi:LuxR family maltose regulon positive regulatory protein
LDRRSDPLVPVSLDVHTREESRPVAGIDLDAPGLGFLLERRRLLDRLRGAGTPLVLLQAPAGYGKSVLLAQWARLEPLPFRSIALTPAHNDPGLLLAALIEALAPVDPLPAAVISPTQSPLLDLDVVVPRLEAALRERTSGTVLVLDELEHLRSEPALRLLDAVLNTAGEGFRVAMATRGPGPSHTVRMQAAGRLAVLGTADLVMTGGEARGLLERVGLDPTDGEIDAIVARAEGWPVALYLAGLGRRSDAELPLPAAGFGGDERGLVDYMRAELLATAAAEDVEFLLRVSILDRLTGPLCDAVAGEVGSGARLAALGRRNMLLIPLDRRDEWFRMHSLFADMLRSELLRRHPDELAGLNQRASRWWDAAGDHDRAIRFAIDAGDLPRAGRLIWEAVPDFNTAGRYPTIQGWLDGIGLDRAARDRHLSATVAHGFLAEGDGGGAEHWAGIARALLGDEPEETAADLDAGVTIVDAALARDGTRRAGETAARARDLLSGESPWLSLTSTIGGSVAHLAGESDAGRRMLSDAARRAVTWDAPLMQVLALGQLMLVDASTGDWQSARILASQTRAQIDRSGLIARPSVALALAACSYVGAVDRRAEEARADLAAGRHLLGRLDGFAGWFEVETAAALAAAAVELGDAETAAAMLGFCRPRLAELKDAPVLTGWIARIEATTTGLVASGAAELTPAELRVLRLLPSQLSYREIAGELFVSQNTVKTHVRSTYMKLGVCSRREAVELGRELNLLPTGG